MVEPLSLRLFTAKLWGVQICGYFRVSKISVMNFQLFHVEGGIIKF